MATEQVYDTLSQPIGSEDTGLKSGGSIGFSFNSDDVSAGFLTDVKVSVSDATPTDGGEVLVRLYATDGGGAVAQPTTQIANLGIISDAQLSLSTGATDIPVAMPITLAPGTQYMVVLTGILGSAATVAFERGSAGIGSHDESYYETTGTVGGDEGIARNDAFFGIAPTAQVTEVTCFVAMTRIITTRGDIAVEDLVVGDIAMTSSGAPRPIRWLGHRAVDLRNHPRPHDVQPIRIAAHALGPNRPARDLRVSPGHAICVDLVGEVLIPAGALVNGATIVQEEVDTVTYWHVELEGGHDIVLAENLPCESYLDMGNRTFFAEGGVVDLHAVPDAAVPTHADFCRPFHADGPVVDFVRERLAARPAALGWRLEEGPLEGNLHLEVDGVRLEPEIRGLSVRFLVPAGATDVWLVSDTTVPALSGQGPDLRALGVCVGAVTIDDGFGAPRVVSADDPTLDVGFHEIEDGPQRWTRGRARLPASLWDGHRGSTFLRVDLTRPALPRWIAPAADADEVALAG